MTEVSFAKSFLTALDSKPAKLPADYVEDPRNYPARTPYILPRLPRAMSKPTTATVTPGQERSIAVTVKSLRNPPLDVRLPAQAPGTSVLDIKAAVVAQTGIPVDKMRLLHRKKPVADSKVLKDLVSSEEETAVEFSVMVLGGVSAAKTGGESKGEEAGEARGAEVLATETFWSDLRGFLLQRVRDEKTAGEVYETFRAAWRTGPGST